jgi:hypothetical protein
MKDKTESGEVESAFIRGMKDKTESGEDENVLHKADEGQNGEQRG